MSFVNDYNKVFLKFNDVELEGDKLTIHGNNNILHVSNCQIIGSNNKLYGSNNDVIGNFNYVRGDGNKLIGCGNGIDGNNTKIKSTKSTISKGNSINGNNTQIMDPSKNNTLFGFNSKCNRALNTVKTESPIKMNFKMDYILLVSNIDTKSKLCKTLYIGSSFKISKDSYIQVSEEKKIYWFYKKEKYDFFYKKKVIDLELLQTFEGTLQSFEKKLEDQKFTFPLECEMESSDQEQDTKSTEQNNIMRTMLCCICLHKDCEYIYKDCGHMGVCGVCAWKQLVSEFDEKTYPKLVTCPICKAKNTSGFLRIYHTS